MGEYHHSRQPDAPQTPVGWVSNPPTPPPTRPERSGAPVNCARFEWWGTTPPYVSLASTCYTCYNCQQLQLQWERIGMPSCLEVANSVAKSVLRQFEAFPNRMHQFSLSDLSREFGCAPTTIGRRETIAEANRILQEKSISVTTSRFSGRVYLVAQRH